ncbi:MAG TPA: ATP-binding protein [Tepidisphaeraceae bacterium]
MSLLWRRLVFPVLLLIGALCCAVIVAASLEASWQAIVWVCIVGGMLAATGAAVAIQFFAHEQSRQITEAFQTAVPRDAGGIAAFVTPPPDSTIEDTLGSLASLFGRKLREAAHDQGRLLTIISSMSEGLVAVDRQQRIVVANRAAETLLGFKLQDAHGRPLWEQVKIDAIPQTANEVMLTGRAKTVRVGPVHGKYMEVIVSRLPASAGIVVVAHDITEATRYERLREEFVANVSHELRTPLSVIKGYVETLRDGAVEDRELATRYLATVANHTEQLTNLVNDILDLSRLEGGGVIASKAPVDLATSIRRVAELMRPAAEAKRHELTVEIDEALPMVIGNDEYLRRAIGNLVENAIKYTRDGGAIKVTAASASGDDQGKVIVTVEDNGIGISEDDLPRIFERFYRSDRSRSREMGGTGLGLSIVKHIVQGHGGSIEVTSTLGAGSRFLLKLPKS